MKKAYGLILCVIICRAMIGTLFAGTSTQEERFVIRGEKLSVEIDADGGRLHMLPSNDDKECRLSLSYPKEKCSVDIRYNEKRSRLVVIMDLNELKLNDEETPTLILELPLEPAIDLSARIKAGEVGFDLGGLKIDDFKLRMWAGEAHVDFAEPNRTTMENLDINVKVGELTVENLGNARYREAYINSGIGELRVDFSGEGLEKCTTRLDLDIGETMLLFPEEVGVKMRVSKFLFLSEVDYPSWFMRKGEYYYSENYQQSPKQHYLMISSGIGELRVQLK